jgi:hypothetical protein
VKFPDFKAKRAERGSGAPARMTSLPLKIDKVMPTIELVEDSAVNLTQDILDEIRDLLD